MVMGRLQDGYGTGKGRDGELDNIFCAPLFCTSLLIDLATERCSNKNDIRKNKILFLFRASFDTKI